MCHGGGFEEHTHLCAVANERDAVSARVRVERKRKFVYAYEERERASERETERESCRFRSSYSCRYIDRARAMREIA